MTTLFTMHAFVAMRSFRRLSVLATVTPDTSAETSDVSCDDPTFSLLQFMKAPLNHSLTKDSSDEVMRDVFEKKTFVDQLAAFQFFFGIPDMCVRCNDRCFMPTLIINQAHTIKDRNILVMCRSIVDSAGSKDNSLSLFLIFCKLHVFTGRSLRQYTTVITESSPRHSRGRESPSS
jgi:hypothetical protein